MSDPSIPELPGLSAGDSPSHSPLPCATLTVSLPRIEQAYAAAIDVLRSCSHPEGMQASAGRHGHRQVWARDSMITLLGASLVDDAVVRNTLHATLHTLRAHQTPSGAIPNNVDPYTGHPNFRAYADGGLWWIVGSTILDPDLATTLPAMERALHWYECQDVDQSGLISMQEAADWQDLFCTRGKGLYVNCLYHLALRRAAAAFKATHHPRKAQQHLERAEHVRRQINACLWYAGDGEMRRHVSHAFSTANTGTDSLGRKRWLPEKTILQSEAYYLPYIAFRAAGEWFDTFGNLLAILSGVASEEQAATILSFISRYDVARFPAAALYPPVEPHHPDWRDYYSGLNLPHCYHNGGIWPFLGGFYVAALVHTGRMQQAREALENLAAMNLQGGFNEWHHGASGEPAGVTAQAWSAGMYLYAYECCRREQLPLLS